MSSFAPEILQNLEFMAIDAYLVKYKLLSMEECSQEYHRPFLSGAMTNKDLVRKLLPKIDKSPLWFYQALFEAVNDPKQDKHPGHSALLKILSTDEGKKKSFFAVKNKKNKQPSPHPSLLHNEVFSDPTKESETDDEDDISIKSLSVVSHSPPLMEEEYESSIKRDISYHSLNVPASFANQIQFDVTSRQKYRSTRLEKISTIEILEKLKTANGDYTSFFYLFVSTGGVEQKRRRLPLGQQTLDRYICRGSDSDDTESDDTESENNDESMETDHDTTTFQSKILVEDNPSLLGSRKAKMRAMKRFYKSILPGVLCPHGWKKVYDKNTKLVYRALFFNVIEKLPNEDDIPHIWRVSQVREVISEEATKLEQQYDVNFAVTSLISKPIVYDEQALEVVSMREGSTQRQQQLYKYFK